MSDIIKHYKKDMLTVVWKPGLCQHSTLCWKGLIEVFDPRNKPWIKMDGAEADRIIAQVAKCPSGALTFTVDEE